jgi:hypothetical protein
MFSKKLSSTLSNRILAFKRRGFETYSYMSPSFRSKHPKFEENLINHYKDALNKFKLEILNIHTQAESDLGDFSLWINIRIRARGTDHCFTCSFVSPNPYDLDLINNMLVIAFKGFCSRQLPFNASGVIILDLEGYASKPDEKFLNNSSWVNYTFKNF